MENYVRNDGNIKKKNLLSFKVKDGRRNKHVDNSLLDSNKIYLGDLEILYFQTYKQKDCHKQFEFLSELRVTCKRYTNIG